MYSMFTNSKFNKDISKWNVSNVENMSGMFFKSKFNQNINNWDISKVTDMSYMFHNSGFNQNISKWFSKLNKNCDMTKFGIMNNINIIHSYDDFKQYHRELILKNL